MGDGIESERILYAGPFGSDNHTFGKLLFSHCMHNISKKRALTPVLGNKKAGPQAGLS
jgi:hypothetical protein